MGGPGGGGYAYGNAEAETQRQPGGLDRVIVAAIIRRARGIACACAPHARPAASVT